MNKRIDKIKKYFGQLNVYDGLNVIYMNFPKKWLENNYIELCKQFNVVVQKNGDFLVFINEMDLGTDPIFDAIDEVIHFNEQLELKSSLFKIKIEELKDLFATESFEKLENLTFTFVKNKKLKNKKRIEEGLSLNTTNDVSDINVESNENNNIKDVAINEEKEISLIEYVEKEVL